MYKVVYIEWRDHYSDYGWKDKEEIKAKGHTNISVGFLLSDIDNPLDPYVTIAQTSHMNEEVVADVLHILKGDVLTVETMEATGLYYNEDSAD